MLKWISNLIMKWGKSGNAGNANEPLTFSINVPFKQTGYKVTDLLVKRRWYTDQSTVGEMYLGEEFLCYTLEDTVRKGTKIFGQTAIPAGRYEIILNFSERFKKLMPLLLDVPEYQGIRIHSGNTSADTEGCILVGLEKAVDDVMRSRDAFNLVFEKIQAIVPKDKLFIQISNLGEPHV